MALYQRNGAAHTWEQLSPGRKEMLAKEFEEIFHDNKKHFLQKLPERVQTPSQYFRYQAGEYQKYAKQIYTWMHGVHGSEYEGAFSEYQRVLRLSTIYRGIAGMIGDKRRSQSIRRQPPHSL